MYRFIKIKGYPHWLLYATKEVKNPKRLFNLKHFSFKPLFKTNDIILFKRSGELIVYKKQLITKAILSKDFPNDGTFKKGLIPFNKGKKATEYLTPEQMQKIQKTQFSSGVNVGENNVCWKGGIQKMKADCTHVYVGVNERVRRPKLNYETHIGEIPKGFIVVHKNGNKDDDSPDNLLAISRGDLMKLNSKTSPVTMDDLIEKYAITKE